MAAFEVPVVRVDRIEEHPGADALEIAVVRGFRCVVKIGAHPRRRSGRLHPGGLHRSRGADPGNAPLGRRPGPGDAGPGSAATGVKAIRLRGIVSQGLLYPVEDRAEGDNLAAELDIVKYEPEIPVHMQGGSRQPARPHPLLRHREHPEVPRPPAGGARKSSSPRSSTAPGPASVTTPDSTTPTSSKAAPSSPRRAPATPGSPSSGTTRTRATSM